MGLVRGEDVILTMAEYQSGVGYVYIPIGCARSVTFDISTDFIETSVTESGQFKTFIPSGKQYSGNIEGLVFLDKPAEAETRATAIIDFSDLLDAGVFPSTDAFGIVKVYEPLTGYVTLYFTTSGTFSNLSDYINTINSGINSGSTGYTSEKSGNILLITARPGLGATINSYPAVNENTFLGIEYSSTNPFSYGITGYFPSKYNLGLLYSKIISGEILGLRYYEVDDNNHFLQKQCSIYIESINETASFDNMVTFSASFKGNGTPTITYGEI